MLSKTFLPIYNRRRRVSLMTALRKTYMPIYNREESESDDNADQEILAHQ